VAGVVDEADAESEVIVAEELCSNSNIHGAMYVLTAAEMPG
jgi:hypothetical protein